MSRPRSERGAATVMGLAAIALVLVVGVAAAGSAAVVLAHRRAAAAADLSALAGAEAARGGGDACAAAATVAAANGARLRRCARADADVDVVVEVAGPRVPGAHFVLRARARAGPAGSAGPDPG